MDSYGRGRGQPDPSFLGLVSSMALVSSASTLNASRTRHASILSHSERRPTTQMRLEDLVLVPPILHFCMSPMTAGLLSPRQPPLPAEVLEGLPDVVLAEGQPGITQERVTSTSIASA